MLVRRGMPLHRPVLIVRHQPAVLRGSACRTVPALKAKSVMFMGTAVGPAARMHNAPLLGSAKTISVAWAAAMMSPAARGKSVNALGAESETVP